MSDDRKPYGWQLVPTTIWEHGPTSGITRALRDLANRKVCILDAWDAVLAAAPTAPASVAAPDVLTLQEVWNAAGGNPDIKPTRQEVLDALKMLDEVCDEAMSPLKHAQGAA